LFRGQPGHAYNVGSDDSITVRELAYEVLAAFHYSPEVVIAKSPVPGRLAERYVPSVKKVRETLGLNSWIKLDEALRRTIKWNQNRIVSLLIIGTALNGLTNLPYYLLIGTL